jgi:hypothetical protein
MVCSLVIFFSFLESEFCVVRFFMTDSSVKCHKRCFELFLLSSRTLAIIFFAIHVFMKAFYVIHVEACLFAFCQLVESISFHISRLYPE